LDIIQATAAKGRLESSGSCHVGKSHKILCIGCSISNGARHSESERMGLPTTILSSPSVPPGTTTRTTIQDFINWSNIWPK
jgi:hypothetical protein